MTETATDKTKAQPAKPRLVDLRTTFLLLPNAEHEERIGRAWIEQKWGEDIAARIVTAIPIARLTDQNTLLVVARKKIKPVTRRQPDASGMPHDYPVPIEELVLDIPEREPLDISKHWLGGDDMGGKINQTTFFEALNRLSQPFCVRFRGDEGLIRLFYL